MFYSNISKIEWNIRRIGVAVGFTLMTMGPFLSYWESAGLAMFLLSLFLP